MPPIGRTSTEVKIAALEKQINQLQRYIEQQDHVLRNTLLKDGERNWEGQLVHTGPLVGFFGVTPQGQAALGSTAADAIATLQRFGLMASS